MNRRDLFKGFAAVVLASRIPLPAVAVARLEKMSVTIRTSLPAATWRKLNQGVPYLMLKEPKNDNV